MAEDQVMRSIYLKPCDDTELRQLARDKRVTKNDLIRSAIIAKLKEWREANGDETLEADLTLRGRRMR
jgi:hypothetical protein